MQIHISLYTSRMWYEKIYMVDYKLQRFLDAQQGVYNQALAEVKNGKKYSHWIWYIFPQFKRTGNEL